MVALSQVRCPSSLSEFSWPVVCYVATKNKKHWWIQTKRCMTSQNNYIKVAIVQTK